MVIIWLKKNMCSFAYYCSSPVNKAIKSHEIRSATLISLKKDNDKVNGIVPDFGSLL